MYLLQAFMCTYSINLKNYSTEPLSYEATILVSPTSDGQDVDISIIPPNPVASETRIQGYQLRITGNSGSEQVVNITAQMR